MRILISVYSYGPAFGYIKVRFEKQRICNKVTIPNGSVYMLASGC